MTPLILAAVLAAQAIPAQNLARPSALPQPESACKPALPVQTAARERQQVRPLGEEPRARQVRTVLREQGGCAYMEVRAPGGWRYEPAGSVSRSADPAR